MYLMMIWAVQSSYYALLPMFVKKMKGLSLTKIASNNENQAGIGNLYKLLTPL